VKPNYKMSCSLCTYKCVEERGKGKHTRALARLAGLGVAWHGVARRGDGRTTCM
jgi:hypothetical protein